MDTNIYENVGYNKAITQINYSNMPLEQGGNYLGKRQSWILCIVHQDKYEI